MAKTIMRQISSKPRAWIEYNLVEPKVKTHKYRCPRCKKVVSRKSNKARLKSICGKYNTFTYLVRIS